MPSSTAARMGGVVDPVLSFLDLDLGRAADADYRDPAGKLGQPRKVAR
jgi:hypothetical protein